MKQASPRPSLGWSWVALLLLVALLTLALPAKASTNPSEPTAVTATVSSGQVALSWSAPATDGGSTVLWYNVSRGTNPAALSLLASPTTTSYTDTSVTNGVTYYYAVTAQNANGEGLQSQIVSATPPVQGPPGAPTVTSEGASSGGLTMGWTAGTGSTTSYRVYMGPSPGMLQYATTTTGTSTFVTALKGTTGWWGAVSGVNAAGEGPRSSTVQLIGTVGGAPDAATITNLRVDGTTSQATLFWTPPANPGSGAITGYSISWGTATGSRPNTVNATPSANCVFQTCEATFSVSGGAAVYVAVTSTSSGGSTTSAESHTAYNNAPGLPAMVDGIVVRPSNQYGALLTWNQASSTSTTGYKIYRSPTAGFTPSAGNLLTTLTSLNTTYLDATNLGQAYYYRVAATSLVGDGPTSYDYGVPACAPCGQIPANPQNLGAFSTASGSVLLTWSPPAWDGGSRLTGYNLYRGTSPYSWALLAQLGPWNATFNDTTTTNGVAYTYRLTATNAWGESSPITSLTTPNVTLAAATPPGAPHGVGAVLNGHTYAPAPSNGLVSFYRLDEKSGTTAVDGFGTHPGTLAGFTPSTLNVAGYYGNAHQFTAGTTKITYGTDEWALVGGSGFGVSAWVKPTTTGNSQAASEIVKQDGSFILRAESGILKGYIWDSSGTLHSLQDSGMLSTTAWTHVALTYNGATLTLYKNGVSVATLSLSTTVHAPDDVSAIGAMGSGAEGWDGLIDEVRVYNRGISAAEVTTAMGDNPQATGSDNIARLTWSYPASDGGGGVLGYRIYRMTNPPTLAASVGNQTWWNETRNWSATDPAYAYAVSAVNAAGEGPTASTATMTPLRNDVLTLANRNNLTLTIGNSNVTVPTVEPTAYAFGSSSTLLGGEADAGGLDALFTYGVTVRACTPNVTSNCATTYPNFGQGSYNVSDAPYFWVKPQTSSAANTHANVIVALVWANEQSWNKTFFTPPSPMPESVYAYVQLSQLWTGASTPVIPYCTTTNCITYSSYNSLNNPTSTNTQWVLNTVGNNTLGNPTATGLGYVGTLRLVVIAQFTGTGGGAGITFSDPSGTVLNSDGSQTRGSVQNKAGYLSVAPAITKLNLYNAGGCSGVNPMVVRGSNTCLVVNLNASTWRLGLDAEVGASQTAPAWSARQALSRSGISEEEEVVAQSPNRTVIVWNESSGVYANVYDANMSLLEYRTLLVHAAGGGADEGVVDPLHRMIYSPSSGHFYLFYQLISEAPGSTEGPVHVWEYNPAQGFGAPVGKYAPLISTFQCACSNAIGFGVTTRQDTASSLIYVWKHLQLHIYYSTFDTGTNVMSASTDVGLESASITGADCYAYSTLVCAETMSNIVQVRQGTASPVTVLTGGTGFGTPTIVQEPNSNRLLIAASIRGAAGFGDEAYVVSYDPVSSTVGAQVDLGSLGTPPTGWSAGLDHVYAAPWHGEELFVFTAERVNNTGSSFNAVASYWYAVIDQDGNPLRNLTVLVPEANGRSDWGASAPCSMGGCSAGAWFWTNPGTNSAWFSWWGRDASNSTNQWNYTLLVPTQSLEVLVQDSYGGSRAWAYVPITSATLQIPIATATNLAPGAFNISVHLVTPGVSGDTWTTFQTGGTSLASTKHDAAFQHQLLSPVNLSTRISASLYVDDRFAENVAGLQRLGANGAAIYPVFAAGEPFQANLTFTDRWGRGLREWPMNLVFTDHTQYAAPIPVTLNLTGAATCMACSFPSGLTESYGGNAPQAPGETYAYSLLADLTSDTGYALNTSVTTGQTADASSKIFRASSWISQKAPNALYVDLMPGDVVRLNATYILPDGYVVPDGTSITAAWYSNATGAGTPVASTTLTTTLGRTSDWDFTLPDSASPAWSTKLTGAGATTTVSQGNDTFTESAKIGFDRNAFDVEPYGLPGNPIKVYNEGDSINLTTCLRHADGGVLRFVRPTGDLSRTLWLSTYYQPNGVGANASLLQYTPFLSSSCMATKTLVLGQALPDSYATSTWNVTGGLSYGLRVYDLNGTTTTDHGNSVNVTNIMDVSSAYHVGSLGPLPWALEMANDVQRATATILGARNQTIPDGSLVNVTYLEPDLVTGHTFNVSTTSGVTANADLTLSQTPKTGTWTVVYSASNVQGNHLNLTTGQTFSVNRSLTLNGFAWNVSGQSTTPYFNWGELVRASGTIKEVDGSTYNRHLADGTNTSRSVNLNYWTSQAGGSRGGSASFISPSIPVDATLGALSIGSSYDTIVPSTATDTYAATVGGIAEAKDYVVYAYDGGTATDGAGNTGNLTNAIDVDGNDYLSTSTPDTTIYGIVMRNDQNRAQGTIVGVRNQTVPDGTTVTVAYYDPNGVSHGWANVTTTSGLTAPDDYTFAQSDAVGTWKTHYQVAASVSSNQNTMTDTTGASSSWFTLSKTPTLVGFDVNVTGRSGVVPKTFQKNETLRVTGVLRHADGGAYRQKLATGGTAARSVTLNLYRSSGGAPGDATSFSTSAIPVDTTTGALSTGSTYDVTVPTSSSNTYTQLTSGSFSNPHAYGVEAFDGGASPSDTNGNLATNASMFDVSSVVFVHAFYEGRNNTDSTDVDFNTGTNDVVGPDSDYAHVYVVNSRGEATNMFNNIYVARQTLNPYSGLVLGNVSLTLTNTGSAGFYNGSWGPWALWTTVQAGYYVESADTGGNTIVRSDAAPAGIVGAKAHYVVAKLEPFDTQVLRGQTESFTITAADSYTDLADNGVLDFSAGQFVDGSISGRWADYKDTSATQTLRNLTFSGQSSPFVQSISIPTTEITGYRDVYLTLTATPYGKLLGREWISSPGIYDHHNRFDPASSNTPGKTLWLIQNQTDWQRSGFTSHVDTTTTPGVLRVAAGQTWAKWNSSSRDAGGQASMSAGQITYTVPSGGGVYVWVNTSDSNFPIGAPKASATASFTTPGTATSNLPVPSGTARYWKITILLVGAGAQVNQAWISTTTISPTGLSDNVGAWLVDDLYMTGFTTDQPQYDLSLKNTIDAVATYSYFVAGGIPENETYGSIYAVIREPGGALAPNGTYIDNDYPINATTNETGVVVYHQTFTPQAQTGSGWSIFSTGYTNGYNLSFAVKPFFGNVTWYAHQYGNDSQPWEITNLFQRGEEAQVVLGITNNLEGYSPSSASVSDDDGNDGAGTLTTSVPYAAGNFTPAWHWNNAEVANNGTIHKPIITMTLNGLTSSVQITPGVQLYSNFTICNLWHSYARTDPTEAQSFVIGAHLVWEWADVCNVRGEPYLQMVNVTWSHADPQNGAITTPNPSPSSDPGTVTSDHGTEYGVAHHSRTGWESVPVVAPADAWTFNATGDDGRGNTANRSELVNFISPISPWSFKCAGTSFPYRVGDTVNMTCYFVEKQSDGTDKPIQPQNPVYIQWFTKTLGDAVLYNMTPRTPMSLAYFQSNDTSAQSLYGNIQSLAYSSYQIPNDVYMYINKGVGFRVDTVYNGIAIDQFNSLSVMPGDDLYRIVIATSPILQPGAQGAITVRTTLDNPVTGPIPFGPDSCWTSYVTGPTCPGDEMGVPKISIKAFNDTCGCWATYNDPANPVNDGTLVGANLVEMQKDYRYQLNTGGWAYTYTYNWTPPASLVGKTFYVAAQATFFTRNTTKFEAFTLQNASAGGGGTDPLDVSLPELGVFAGHKTPVTITASWLNASVRLNAAASVFVTITDTDNMTVLQTNQNPVEYGDGVYRYNYTPPWVGNYEVKVTTLAPDGSTISRAHAFYAGYDFSQNLTSIQTQVEQSEQNITARLNATSATSLANLTSWMQWLTVRATSFSNLSLATNGNQTLLGLGYWDVADNDQVTLNLTLPPFWIRGVSTSLPVWANNTVVGPGSSSSSTYDIHVEVNGQEQVLTMTISHASSGSQQGFVTFPANTIPEGEGTQLQVLLTPHASSTPLVSYLGSTSVYKVSYLEPHSLAQGWQFTTFPNLVGNVSISTAIAGQNIDLVKYFDPIQGGAPMIWDASNPGLSNLLVVNRSMGLWVHFVTVGNQNLDTGYLTTQAKNLVGGQDNPVAYLGASPEAPSSLAGQLSTAGAHYVVSTNNPDANGVYQVYDSQDATKRSLTTLLPGRAYVVHVDTDMTWTVTN